MPRGINPVTVQSKNGRLNILKKATKSVERLKRKLSAAPGRLLTSRTKGAKRAAADAEENPAVQVPAKAARRRKNRDRSIRRVRREDEKSLFRDRKVSLKESECAETNS